MEIGYWKRLKCEGLEKAEGKDEVMGEMIKGGGDRVVDWIRSLCNTAFESSGVPEDWRSAMIVLLYKGKGERTKCINYRGISLISVVRKFYAGILVDRVRKVNEGFIDDEQGGFTRREDLHPKVDE